MKILNKNGRQVMFKPTEFPDGQQQVTIEGFKEWARYANDYKEFDIIARLNNFKDLELIVCAVKSLRGLFAEKIHLFVPYFLGSRSDRKFEQGSNNYLKDVICPIINSLELNSVSTADPHSDVLEACLNNFTKTDLSHFYKWVLDDINGTIYVKNPIIMSPDAGALKKIYKTAEMVGFTGEIVNCNKSRGMDGKITKTEVPFIDLTQDIVLIDDICDGGRTFIEIAKIICQRQADANLIKERGELYLIITHGIFSKGLSELMCYFKRIYCTNSYKEIENQEVIKQYKLF